MKNAGLKADLKEGGTKRGRKKKDMMEFATKQKPGRKTGGINMDQYATDLNETFPPELIHDVAVVSGPKSGPELRQGDQIFDLLTRQWVTIKDITYMPTDVMRTEVVCWIQIEYVGIFRYKAALRRFAVEEYKFYVRREG